MYPVPCQHRQTGKQQHGAALAMAMLCLVVLSILGVAGMTAARLEMLVAGNKGLQNIALAHTEFVLAAGEQDIMQLTLNPFSPDVSGDHYYPIDTLDFNPVTANVIERPGDRAWLFSHATVPIPDLDNDGITDDGSGEYVIQDAGLLTNKGEDASVNGTLRPLPGARMQAFRVTAHSTRLRGAQRSVQTVVVREPLPQQR